MNNAFIFAAVRPHAIDVHETDITCGKEAFARLTGRRRVWKATTPTASAAVLQAMDIRLTTKNGFVTTGKAFSAT